MFLQHFCGVSNGVLWKLAYCMQANKMTSEKLNDLGGFTPIVVRTYFDTAVCNLLLSSWRKKVPLCAVRGSWDHFVRNSISLI